ncbi:hypothetical protein GALL_263480 [mine drainage metagenome]|uniref:Uncharacterized protein n=1 Tax=mine drainage metagenome TaxID=410659 RepID=A0A1J5RUL8_9ZZZZ
MSGNKVIQTAGLAPARVRLFQPTQRPTPRNGEWITTAWGRCSVTGRLGQRHADLLEAIQFCAERREDEPSGMIRLLVDPARVRKVMSDARYSQKQIWVLLREMRAVTIEIDTQERRIMGGVINEAEYTRKITRRDPFTGEARRLWVVWLGKAWAEIMRLDKALNYDPTPIVRLEHGISQAVARLLITHSVDRQPNGGWKIDTVIEATAGDLCDQALRDARRRLRADAQGLAAIGIRIDGDRIRRVAHPPTETAQSVAHPPDRVAHPPDRVAHPPDRVAHPPDRVAHPPGSVAHPPDSWRTRPVPLGISGLFRPEMADSLAEPAVQANPTAAGHPPLPGLVTAACPAPAGALAFGRQHDGDQTSVAGTGTVAGDEKSRPHIVAGSIRGRPKSKNSLLMGLIARPATSAPPTTRKAAKDDSDAFAGQSCIGGTHG